MQAVDFSWARPGADHLRAAGVDLVFRYLAHDNGKVLTGAEAATYLAAGIAISPNFEDTAGNALRGYDQGVADANFANDEADGLRIPPDVWVWYSVDTFATAAQVRGYFQGIQHANRRPAGFYGGLQVGQQLRAEGLVEGVWCANAASWSGYSTWTAMAAAARAVDGAHVLQHLDHPLPGLDPGAYDYNEVLRPFPMWRPNQEEEMTVIYPRRIAPGTFPMAEVRFDPATGACYASHGALFVPSSGFAVNDKGDNALLTAAHATPLAAAESPKGDALVITDAKNAQFVLKYHGPLAPDPWTAAGGAVDVNALAAAVAAKLQVTPK